MDLTEGLILSSMMGNGGGSGGSGNPGYHVETKNLGTLIPQQTVTTEEHEGVYGALVTVTIPEGMDAPPEQVQVVFDGVTYLCPYDDESRSFGAPIDQDTGLITDWSEYPFTIALGPDSPMMTQTGGSHTVEVDIVAPQLVVDPEFEEAVNQVVGEGGGSGGSDESELPSLSGKGGAFLQVNTREEGVQWTQFGWQQQTTQNNNPAIMNDDHLNIKRLYFYQNELVQLRSYIRQYGFGPLKANAILPVYSANGLEIVYLISTTGNASIIYDKNTTTGSTSAYGEVILFY